MVSCARALGRIASLFATAKVNDIEPFAYLKATLEVLAADHPVKYIEGLLPWDFKPAS